MVEYEKRIASGDLVDGDNFQVIELDLDQCFSCMISSSVLLTVFLYFHQLTQVDTIQQLQRLYEDLVENEEACQLDRYQSSEKSGR